MDSILKKITGYIKRIGYFFIFIGGVLAIIFGIAGLVLPIIPGWLLIIIGVLILGEKNKISKFILNKLPKQVKEALMKRKNK